MTKIVFVTADDMSTSVVHLFCLLALMYSGIYIVLYISCDKINITVSSIFACFLRTKLTCFIKHVVPLLLFLSSGVKLSKVSAIFHHLFFPLLIFLSLCSPSPVSTSFCLLLLFFTESTN